MVAENVKRIITEKGLKQKTVAAKAGYTEKQLSNMLSKRKNIYDIDIVRLCKALEVTPNDLLTDNNT